MAKESVVSTLNVLTGGETMVHTLLSPLAAMSILVFCLLYTPCVAAVASVRRELGVKWASIVVISQCAVAWIAAFGVYQIGTLLGLG